MGIQNNINAMLGTTAAAATMGKHLKEQSKANAIKIAETEVDAAVAEEEARQAAVNLDKFDADFEKANEELIDQTISTSSPEDHEELINNALTIKHNKALADQEEASLDRAENYTKGKGSAQRKLNATLDKNLEMAQKALDSVEGERESRRQLQFNKDLAIKKSEAYKLQLEKLKGGKR